MQSVRAWLVVAVALLLGWWLAGCSGGGRGRVIVIRSGSGSIASSDPELVDGSHGDTIHFTANRTGMVVVSMSGSEVDPYVVVWRGSAEDFTSTTLIGGDDDSGVGLDALVVFQATGGQSYSVRFTTYGPDDFGAYKYLVAYADNRAAPLLGDENLAAPKLAVESTAKQLR